MGASKKLCERWAFELHHIAVRVCHINGRTVAFRTESLLNGACLIAMERQLCAQCPLVKRIDPQTEVVQVAPFRAGRGTTGTPELSSDGHEVNERTAGAKLNQADFILAPFHSAAECIAVEMQHFLQVNDAEHEVIDVEETKHGVSSWRDLGLLTGEGN